MKTITRRARKPGTTGKTLETLVLASQTSVVLTQVKQAARRIRGGEVVCVRGPCDVFGCFKSDGRLLVFDCKESNDPNRLCTDSDHLPEHQRLELLRYADAGAVAGVLALCRPTSNLYWFPSYVLHPRQPSLSWYIGVLIGAASMAIDWTRVRPGPCPAPGHPRQEGGEA